MTFIKYEDKTTEIYRYTLSLSTADVFICNEFNKAKTLKDLDKLFDMYSQYIMEGTAPSNL